MSTSETIVADILRRSDERFDEKVMDELMSGAGTVLELTLALKNLGGGIARVDAAIARLIDRGLVVKVGGDYVEGGRSAPIFDMARTGRVA